MDLKEARKLYTRSWRKSRLAARLLVATSRGRVTPRRCELAAVLAKDKSVENRLIDQALAGLYARRPHTVPIHRIKLA